MIIYTYENKLDSFEYIIHFTQGLNKNQFFVFHGGSRFLVLL